MAFAFKFRFVIVKAFDRIWPDPVAAMALGHIARFHAANFHINHVAIQEADNALQRTHPTETRPARFHRLWPREIIHHLRQEHRDNIRRGLARFFNLSDVKLAFFIGLNFSL